MYTLHMVLYGDQGGINVFDVHVTDILRYETFVRTYTLHMLLYDYRGVVKKGDSVLFKDQLWRVPRRSALFPHG